MYYFVTFSFISALYVKIYAQEYCIKFREYLPNKCMLIESPGSVRLLSRLLPSSCCTLRACGNDRPGLTRRQSRSRLRGSYEEVGGNIFFLSLTTFARRDSAVIFPTQSPWQRFDYFLWRRRQRRHAIGRAPLPMIVRPEVRAVSLALRYCAGALGGGECASLAATFHSVFPIAAGSVARWPRNARRCLGCVVDSRLAVAPQLPRVAAPTSRKRSLRPRLDLLRSSRHVCISADFSSVKIGGNETSAAAVKDEVTHKCATSANDRGFSPVLFCDT